MCGVWTGEEGRAEAGPAWEGQMAAAVFQFTRQARLAWLGAGGWGLEEGEGGEKNQGSVGRERPGSGADAWRTIGLLKGMLEEVWRALCAASSALQVGIGQLNFNEVHSKVCSSAWAFRAGARLNGEWGGGGGGGR